jgi:mitotic spindle assembly checkpoint protein MAD2B
MAKTNDEAGGQFNGQTAASAYTSNSRGSSGNGPVAYSAAPATTTPTTATTNHNRYSHLDRPLPDTYASLIASVTSFLAVSMHQILYLRSVYPQATFLPVRHFNYPVRQSRHPKVCMWISDACSAVEAQLLKCTVAAVSVVILSVRTNRPLERYTFDMTQMPQVPAGEAYTPFESGAAYEKQNSLQQQHADSDEMAKRPSSSLIDLEAQFRAVLARLASTCARLTPLPPDEEYTPTLHIVLRNDAEAPVGVTKEEQVWIAAEPDLSTSGSRGAVLSNDSYNAHHGSPITTDTSGKQGQGRKTSGSRRAKTLPVRTVDAGEMKLEVWVEEATGKFEELDRIDAEHPP